MLKISSRAWPCCLATAIAAVGQNSVEYGRLPIVPPKVPNPASKLASRVGDQGSAHKTTSVVDIPSQDSKATSRDKNTGVDHQTAAAPKPAAIFILSNGERLESDNYILNHDSVQLMQNGAPRTIQMSAINIQATVAANKQRGIDLKVPADKSQMVLSF